MKINAKILYLLSLKLTIDGTLLHTRVLQVRPKQYWCDQIGHYTDTEEKLLTVIYSCPGQDTKLQASYVHLG